MRTSSTAEAELGTVQPSGEDAQAARHSRFSEEDIANPPAPTSPFDSQRVTTDGNAEADADAGIPMRETPDDFPTLDDGGPADANGGHAEAELPVAAPASHQGTPTLHAAAAQREQPHFLSPARRIT